MLPFLDIAAANQAFFNNSMACGECYEIYGPDGNATVIVRLICI